MVLVKTHDGISIVRVEIPLKNCGNSRGGGTKKLMSSTGGVRIKNAICHYVMRMYIYHIDDRLSESTFMDQLSVLKNLKYTAIIHPHELRMDYSHM